MTTFSGGDPLRDAFRNEIETIITAAGITWSHVDTWNTDQNPDASAPGWITLEFPGGGEQQFTTGAPGFNLFQENGQVTVRVFCRIARNRNTAESYAATIRNAFRARKFACGSATIRITDTAPMGGGEIEGSSWAESVAIGYEVFNTG